MSDTPGLGSIQQPLDVSMNQVSTSTSTRDAAHSHALPWLPPIVEHPSHYGYGSAALPPMRLQSTHAPQHALPQSGLSRSPLSIAQLLSSDCTSSTRPEPRAQVSPSPTPTSHESSTTSWNSGAPPRSDHLPVHNASPPSRRWPKSVDLDTKGSHDRADYSPTTTSQSSASGSQSDYSEPARVQPVPRKNMLPNLNYQLSVRQQPTAARACGFGERDRRTVDPPPIVELKITNKTTGEPEQDPSALLALHCTLLTHDGRAHDFEAVPPQPNRQLMGTLVASPYQSKDNNGIAGTFFVFSDLSCRHPGKFRLTLTLLRVDPTNMLPGAVHGSVANVVTDIFTVFTAKDFPGMRASSALLKSLRRQGLNVGVKKGSEARNGKRQTKRKVSSGEEDDVSVSDDDCSPVGGLELDRGPRSGMSIDGTAAIKHKASKERRIDS